MTGRISTVKLFVYEAICAGALDGAPQAAALFPEGWAMLRSIVSDLAAVQGVERVRTMLAPRLRDLAAALGPRIEGIAGGGDALGAFDAEAAAADAALVIAPECDGLLATLSRRVLDAGGRLLGSSPEACDLAGDKLRLSGILRRLDIPAPELARAASEPPRLRYPAALKPRFGAGCIGAFRVANAAGYAAAFDRARAEAPSAELLIGPWIPGIAASASFIAGGGGPIALSPGFQRIAESGGRLRYLGGSIPLAPPELAERATALARRAIAAVPGLRGFAGVDLALGARPEDDAVIEINPRLTTSYLGLRVHHAPRSLAAIWMERVLRGETSGAGEAVPPGPAVEFSPGGAGEL
jgi:hypothetical protein